jgi:probable blue pigment (indigoidine) exporter
MSDHRIDLRSMMSTASAPVLWGTTYITITHSLQTRPALLIAAARVLLAGVALATWRPSSRHGWRGSDRTLVAAVGVTNFAIFFPLLTVAVQRLPGGVAAAVGGIAPMLVCVLTATVERRAPLTSDLAWSVLAAVGVVFVVIRPGAGLDRFGILAAIGANVSFAIGTVITKRIAPTADRVTLTGQQLLVAAGLLVPLTLIVNGAPSPPKPSELAGIAYLAGVATAFAFVRWFNGIRRLPTAAPPLLGLLAPLTGTVIGWALLGQSMTRLQVMGFAITATAIAAGTSRRSPT